MTQVEDKEYFGPWGEAYATIYDKVGPHNPVHLDPMPVPQGADSATSSVQAPAIITDSAISNSTRQTYVDQFRQGSELYSQGRYAQSVECFHAADRLRPGQADCVVMLANCYQSMDQHSKAEGIYKYATDLDPHHAIAWYNRGLTLQALGRWQESRDCQLNALRDHYLTGTPAMESIASTLAACFVKLGDAKSGCRLLSELVGSGPHPLAQQLAEYLSDSGEPGKAIDVLKQQHPADLEAWYKDAVGALALNNNFRQSDLLSRLLTIQNFTVPKHPRCK